MEYLPFRVSTLRGDQKIDFNAYVRVNDKFILYVRRGDSFEGKRLAKLKEKKLKKMFLRQEDESLYRSYLERNIEMAYDRNSGKSVENRAEIVQGAQQSNTEEVLENADNAVAYTTAKEASAKFASFLQNEDAAFASVMAIDNVDQSIAHHGVTVSTLSLMLAQRLGITDPKQTQLLGLGALLHDFDHYHNNLNLTMIDKFEGYDLQKYKNHPKAGAEAVKDKKHFDSTVIKIILQHEEYADGNGFPNQLRESEIDPLAMIVATCNALDRIITFENVPKTSAMKRLMINKVGCYPLGHLQHLAEIMNKIK